MGKSLDRSFSPVYISNIGEGVFENQNSKTPFSYI